MKSWFEVRPEQDRAGKVQLGRTTVFRREGETEGQRSRPTALEVGQGEMGRAEDRLGREAHQWIRQRGLEAAQWPTKSRVAPRGPEGKAYGLLMTTLSCLHLPPQSRN